MIKKLLVVSLVAAVCRISTANATDFFVEDFESGGFPTTTTGTWKLQSSFDNDFGQGDLFEVVTSVAHSGSHSLRFSYNGKNGYCNTCGLTTFHHKIGLNGVDYFVSDAGDDLVSTAAAEKGKLIYNLTDGVSLWEIDTVETDTHPNDKLTLKLLKKGIKGIGDNNFDGGDTVQIARQCGVDGTFANDIDRRTDCDRAISYFAGVPGSQLPGESIFRRMYVRFDVSEPADTTKLRYWRVFDSSKKGTIYLHFRVTAKTKPNGYPFVDLTELIPKGDPDVVVTPPSTSEIAVFYPNFALPSSTTIDRTKWYYIQEEFKASSSIGAKDGEYRLWFGESGNEPLQSNPTLEVKNFNLPVVNNASLWGNIQHFTHSIGHIYIDDISITNTFNEPVVKNISQILPPKVPSMTP